MYNTVKPWGSLVAGLNESKTERERETESEKEDQDYRVY